jgi:hypothetical protein
MPRYPDESLPSIQMSLADFVDTAQTILSAPDADPRDFVHFVLAGRLKQDDGLDKRVFVNAREDAFVPGRGEYQLRRDYDSGFGTTRDFPFTAAMAIFPVASFADTLKKDNHIRGLAIAQDVSGNTYTGRVFGASLLTFIYCRERSLGCHCTKSLMSR